MATAKTVRRDRDSNKLWSLPPYRNLPPSRSPLYAARGSFSTACVAARPWSPEPDPSTTHDARVKPAIRRLASSRDREAGPGVVPNLKALPRGTFFCCSASSSCVSAPAESSRHSREPGPCGGAKRQSPSSGRLAPPLRFPLFQGRRRIEPQRSHPERPGSGSQHEGGDQGVGRGVGQHRVAQAAPMPKDQGVEHPRDGAGNPALVHRTEEK